MRKITFIICLLVSYMASADNDPVYIQIINQELRYCQEIDEMVYNTTGQEIDADMYDLDNAESMEKAAYMILGDYFYYWRQKCSKEAWEYDVMIARYCY